MSAIDKSKFFQWIGYKPHPQQLAFHNSQARFRIACCGRRFGKSTMAARDLEPHLFLHNKRFWIVGPTYDLAEKEFRVIWDDLIIGKQFGKDKRVKKAYNKRSGDMFIEFPWRTRVEARSADHPENLVGEALDGIIISEAAKQKEETWKRFIRPALTDKRGFATFPTTPEGFNWLHELWQLGQNPDHPLYESWQFPSWENSAVYPMGKEDPEIRDLQNTTSEEWFAQEIGAEFNAFVGKIYGEFQEKDHVRKIQFNPAWPNYIAFDWGFTNPLAAIEFQISPRDEIFVWREHYIRGLTLGEHVQRMKDRDQPIGYHIDMGFGDAADPEAAASMSQMLVATYCDSKAKENWRQGVEVVKRFLKRRKDGSFGFYVDFSCTNTIREFNNYRSKEPVKGNNVPEMGQKQDDHALDAIRYALVHLYVLGANNHLSQIYTLETLAATAQQERRYIDTFQGTTGNRVDEFLSLSTLSTMSGMESGSLFTRGGRF